MIKLSFNLIKFLLNLNGSTVPTYNFAFFNLPTYPSHLFNFHVSESPPSSSFISLLNSSMLDDYSSPKLRNSAPLLLAPSHTFTQIHLKQHSRATLQKPSQSIFQFRCNMSWLIQMGSQLFVGGP